jgi:hypothetical protein
MTLSVTKAGALWGDVFIAPGGIIGCSYDQGNDVCIDFYTIENDKLVKKDSTLFNFDERVLFNRSDINGLGHILVIGQGNGSGKFLIKSKGGNYPDPNKFTYGTHTSDLQPTSIGFNYVVQISGSEFYRNDGPMGVIPPSIHGTSNGIIQLTNDGIRWADLWREAIPTMFYPFQTDNVFCGEGRLDPPHIQVLEDRDPKNIFWGIGARPRAAYSAAHNIYATASRGPAGVTFNFFRRPLPNLVVDTPKPDPKPDPPTPEPTPMEMEEKVKDTFRRFFSKFPLEKGEDNIREQVIRANEQVAYDHKNQGYGTKRADPGRPVSKDGHAREVNDRLYVWDIVLGAGTNNPKLNFEKAIGEDITGQIFIGPGDALDNGDVFIPTDYLNGQIPIPNPDPDPEPPIDCTPSVPPQNYIRDSLNVLREFCQNYIAPPNALPEYAGRKPYENDEIHEGGLYIGDGLIYFMMSDTGRWAQVLMNPTDTRPWDAKRFDADMALQTYMKRRVGDNS